ncbi:hypothetical protein CCACVL1_00875 [Corchorus capsularis]|uniref:Uncharacterized protein n=1 Tax=Corchorus capsularis TaxID=210143 RepID=A0A1R3KTZ7_COCAP|nr:hypothetical protein CCACVL1_00875 [Corchorus capsularis]
MKVEGAVTSDDIYINNSMDPH